MKIAHWIVLIAILLFPVAAFWFYPQMPDSMATHWGFNGQPDGYMNKFYGTFVIPMILIIPLTAFWIVSIVMSKSHKTCGLNGQKSRLMFDCILTVMAIFFLMIYVSTLIWNAGHQFNMNLFMMIVIPALLVSVFGSIIYVIFKKEDLESVSLTGCGITKDGYKDSLIEITGDKIKFNDYYFPAGDKTVEFSRVEYIKEKPLTIWNGKWKFHGSCDFKTWLPADYNRYKRDKLFVMKVKGKWTQIGFTVENSQAVSEILKSRNLIKG